MKNRGFVLFTELVIIIIIIATLIVIAKITYDKHTQKAPIDQSTVVPSGAIAKVEPVLYSLKEQCVNTFVYVVGSNNLVQKMDEEGKPARC